MEHKTMGSGPVHKQSGTPPRIEDFLANSLLMRLKRMMRTLIRKIPAKEED